MWSGSRGLSATSADEAGIQATVPALPTVLLEALLVCIVGRDVMGSVYLIIQIRLHQSDNRTLFRVFLGSNGTLLVTVSLGHHVEFAAEVIDEFDSLNVKESEISQLKRTFMLDLYQMLVSSHFPIFNSGNGGPLNPRATTARLV